MCNPTMHIGTVARMSGVRAGAIRYYESVGFLPPARRNLNGYRTYTIVDVDTLTFIKSARSLGFSIEDVSELLVLSHKGCQAVSTSKAAVERHMEALERKIDDLNAMRRAILALVESCKRDCRLDHPSLGNVTNREATW